MVLLGNDSMTADLAGIKVRGHNRPATEVDCLLFQAKIHKREAKADRERSVIRTFAIGSSVGQAS